VRLEGLGKLKNQSTAVNCFTLHLSVSTSFSKLLKRVPRKGGGALGYAGRRHITLRDNAYSIMKFKSREVFKSKHRFFKSGQNSVYLYTTEWPKIPFDAKRFTLMNRNCHI
jgi:hypothetical protein